MASLPERAGFRLLLGLRGYHPKIGITHLVGRIHGPGGSFPAAPWRWPFLLFKVR